MKRISKPVAFPLSICAFSPVSSPLNVEFAPDDWDFCPDCGGTLEKFSVKNKTKHSPALVFIRILLVNIIGAIAGIFIVLEAEFSDWIWLIIALIATYGIFASIEKIDPNFERKITTILVIFIISALIGVIFDMELLAPLFAYLLISPIYVTYLVLKLCLQDQSDIAKVLLGIILFAVFVFVDIVVLVITIFEIL